LIGIAIGTIGTILALNLFFPDPKNMDEDPATVSADSPTFSAETQESSSAPRAQESATGAELSIETPEAVDEFSAPIGAVQNFESDIGKSAAPEPEPGEHVAVPVSDAHKPFLGREDGGGRSDTHTELENEPEDAGWSYFMEQALSQFLSQHPNAGLFNIFNIECRTTICEIQALGYNDSTAPDWSRIMYDLQQQPWYDFGQVGTSQNDYQGQLAIVTHLRRTSGE
jgi:hypothetical protein